jgi:hypothetical protein
MHGPGPLRIHRSAHLLPFLVVRLEHLRTVPKAQGLGRGPEVGRKSRYREKPQSHASHTTVILGHSQELLPCMVWFQRVDPSACH